MKTGNANQIQRRVFVLIGGKLTYSMRTIMKLSNHLQACVCNRSNLFEIEKCLIVRKMASCKRREKVRYSVIICGSEMC